MKQPPGDVEDPDAVAGRTMEFRGAEATFVGGYLASPVAADPAAAILVIHEAFGLNAHIEDVARRFANIGYLALAPDLYARTAKPDPQTMDSVLQAMFGLPDSQIVGDLRGAVTYLRSHPGIRKVACIGFCSGGRQTLLGAFSGAGFDAAVDCWGGYVRRATPDALTTKERPVPVLGLSNGLACPLFAAFGAEDQNPSPEDAMELRRLTAGKDVKVKVYEAAGHAFFADYRPSYREAPARLLWDDVTAFLAKHLR